MLAAESRCRCLVCVMWDGSYRSMLVLLGFKQPMTLACNMRGRAGPRPVCVCLGEMGATCVIGASHMPLCVAVFVVAGVCESLLSGGMLCPSSVLNGSLVCSW